ncbi:MAG: SpoIIE family protein phosphatase [Ignavibacteriales bacterium]|nr:MAG: SpoIIE family protein phosphatase [Ignavibacteriales bacterium]
MKSFRIKVVIRVLLLAITIFLLFYLYQQGVFAATLIIISVIVALQIISLIRFVETTNRELSKFFLSVKHSDFSQSFLKQDLGPTFNELSNSLSNVINQFQIARSEKEEHFQYLQTIVKHIGTGMISFRDNGQIELMNDAAKELLGTSEIKNIQSLSAYNENFVQTLKNIKSGERELLKIETDKKIIELSLFATEFKLRNTRFTLVTLQDISSELERERLSSELEIARQVQRRLLPTSNPNVKGYSIAGLCIPANEVGGDYYDFIQIDENKLGFVIADVSGKGLPAAFYMTLTKGIFQSFAKSKLSPKEVLIKINSLLYSTIERGSFVTMFYGVLDISSGKFQLARAGHEPAIFVSEKEKQTTFIRPQGLGLGLEDGHVFAQSIVETELQLNDGDLLFFYTDGFTDARNRLSEEFGKDSILSLMNRVNGLSSEDLVRAVSNEISNYSRGVPQFDDMTFIAVKTDNKS